MAYKWVLRKSSKKEICPSCGAKRFVPYVSASDGETLAGAEYGRCDREQSCGYHLYPTGKRCDAKPIVRKQAQPIRFSPSCVQVNTHSALFVYVASTFGTHNAIQVWNEYQIGATGDGRTIFWQIAANGEIRAGKTIPYLTNGHRDKRDAFPAGWLHKMPNYAHSGEELQQCFFGEHLLAERPDAPVVVVESEKTAAVMSCMSKRFVWLASGGSQGLKNDAKCQALKGRDVTLIPDNGQYWNWQKTAKKYGWDIIDTIERYPVFEGCDILDMVESGALGEDLLRYKKK